ncbi:exported protein of unknown function [Nitrospira sp. KM1]|uniref:hypothetical protein n=1 Tax=Nitrospira sp. KM1 TaxID=1936990 RepID=UPI0013A75042|nr:hypothetical protein [Nitrospira sp. KM1]BCA54919.1 exported protein of unknown function [Nitrospira sp. KM1]
MNTLGDRLAQQQFSSFLCPGSACDTTGGKGLGQVTQNFQATNIALKSSAIVGGKAGYFFKEEGFSWLGVEVEAFTTTPTIKNQSITTAQGIVYTPFQQPPTVSINGGCQGAIGSCAESVYRQGTLQLTESRMRLITVAFNVVARYPGKVFQPYVGVGAGAFYFSSTGQISGRQVVPGLNLSTGIKILLTETWGLFLEGKYNRATFSNLDPNFGLSGEYSAFNGIGGIAYHF